MLEGEFIHDFIPWARMLVFGVSLGMIAGFVLVNATDYCDDYCNDHIYYMWHKQTHSTPQLEYHFSSNMSELDPVTYGDATQAFNEAAGEWNSGSNNSIKLANVQDTGQNNVIYAKSHIGDAIAKASWDEYETQDGKSYRRPTNIIIWFDDTEEWEKYGGLSTCPPFSVKGVAMHELGHWLDLYDIEDEDYDDVTMWWLQEFPHKDYLHQIDKNTIWKIYSDPRWNQFDFGVYYENGGYEQIWGEVWQPGWYQHSSSGPSDPPNMVEDQERTFYVDTSGIRGAEEFSYPAHTTDMTMRVIWDDNSLLLVDCDTYVDEPPYVTEDSWWFAENPYTGDDTAWLCVNYNADEFSSQTHKGSEIYVELRAEQTGTDIPVTVRLTSADYHANPWEDRAEHTFRFDIE